jgi:hypothetical protein
MLTPTRGLLRGLRAASLGGVGFVLALVAHLAAGGAAPGPVALLVLAGLISLAAVRLTGTRLSPVRVGVSLTAMQVVLHEAFMWLGAPAACSMSGVSAPPGGPMGHGGGPMPLGECASGMAQAMGQGSTFAATAMISAHVAAMAVMAALLAYGDQVLWFLAACVLPSQWLRVGLPELPAARVASSGAPRILRLRYARGGVGRRGPPWPALVASFEPVTGARR